MYSNTFQKIYSKYIFEYLKNYSNTSKIFLIFFLSNMEFLINDK